jgi:hypothetical protein
MPNGRGVRNSRIMLQLHSAASKKNLRITPQLNPHRKKHVLSYKEITFVGKKFTSVKKEQKSNHPHTHLESVTGEILSQYPIDVKVARRICVNSSV